MKIAPLAMAISLGYTAQAIKLRTHATYDPSFDYSQFDGGEYSSTAGVPAAAKFIALSRAPVTFDDGTCEIYVGFQAPDGGGAKMPDIQGFAISAQPGGFDLDPPTIIDSTSPDFIWRWAAVNDDPHDSKYGTAFGTWQDFPVGPLIGDQQYTIHISSMNANGSGNLGKVTGNGDPTLGAMEVKCPPGPPGIPQNVQVVNPTLYTLDVTWEAALHTGGEAAVITNYHVHFEDEETPFTSVPAAPLQATKDGLTPATDYKFKVCSDNSYYIRCSDFAWGTTLFEAPGAPENLAAAGISPHDVDTTWDAPLFDGGAAIEGYYLYHSVNETIDETTQTVFTADTFANLWEGYDKNTYHCYWASAFNAAGEGPRAGPACDWTFKTIPSPPVDLSADNIQATSFDLHYFESVDFGGLPELIKYDLFVQTENVAPDATATPITVPFPGLFATANGLTRATDYYVWARATNEVGDSLWADLNDDTTDDNDRGECVSGVNCGSKITTAKTVPSAPQNLDGQALSPNSNGNTWDIPEDDGGAPILYYNLYTSPDDIMPGEETLSVDTLDYIWNGLPKYSYWCYWVTAVNEVGESLAAGPVCLNTQSTVPSHAFWQEVLYIDEGTADVYWDMPADDGGKDILGYKIFVDQGCDVAYPTGEAVATADAYTTWQSIDVVENQDYTVFVIPFNADGDADFEIRGTPFHAQADRPSNDAAFSATAGVNSATLHFSAPSDNGNAPLTHFNIYNDFGELIGEPDTTVTEWPVSGLKSGGHYCYTLAVSNRKGESDLSFPVCVDV